ncbi:molybdopterin-dependent oxidoreductase [Vibrio vulnificus]|nr:molybdopterin-dependent oxidoreductase [Vibrio vulnificus]
MNIKIAGLVFSIMVYANMSLAEIFPPSQGEVILTISGKIANKNSPNGLLFDRDKIESFEQVTINTDNHVIASIFSYRGPRLSDLLNYAGITAESREIIVIAWDDYVAKIPIDDITNYPVILATHENGRQMTLDDKGPLFVVYPFTDYSELRFDLYYNRSVWQVREIKVE